jgi:hypothetical protein
LSSQPNVEADFVPDNFESPCASEAKLLLLVVEAAATHQYYFELNSSSHCVPRHLIGRSTELTRWPPRSLVILFVGTYQRQRYVLPVPVSANDLKQRVTTAAASVDEDMLRCVWNELDYHIDICSDNGSHAEHF